MIGMIRDVLVAGAMVTVALAPPSKAPQSVVFQPGTGRACVIQDVVKALQVAAGEDTGDPALDFPDPKWEDIQDDMAGLWGTTTLEIRPPDWGPRPESVEELEGRLERAKRQRARAEARDKIERARKDFISRTLEACRR